MLRMYKVFHVCFIVLIISIIFISPGAVFADEITDSIKRKYKKNKSSVPIEIITDSPAFQSMVMVFSNPAYASAGGGKLTKIKKQKAIIKYHPSKQNGEINIVVAKQYLASVKGRNINQNDLVDYASAVDYKKLKKF